MLINVTLPVFNEEPQLAASVRRVVAFLEGIARGAETRYPRSRNLDESQGVAELRAPELATSRREDDAPRSPLQMRNRRTESRMGNQGSTESHPPEMGICWELVIAENGSTDRTRGIAERLAKELPGVRVETREAPGRGAALRAAWLRSAADALSYVDVDLSTDLACFPPLIDAVAQGGYDLAVGSRLMAGAQVVRSRKRELLSRGYNRLLHLAPSLRVLDAQCGFKAIRREAAQALLPQVRDDGWFFDTELLVLAQRAGYRTAEMPVRWVDDPGSTVNIPQAVWRDLRGVWRLWWRRGG